MKQTHFLSPWIYGIPVGILLLFSSCWPTSAIYDPYFVDESRQQENIYYVPSMPNTPLLSKKGDLDFNLARSSGSKFTGVELQAAYLPGKHVGLLGSYSYASNNDAGQQDMKYNRYELGSGYTTQFSGLLHFETYAGFGNGRISNTHYTGSSNVSLTHFFLQPAFAISNEKKTIQLGFVSRFSGVNFRVKDTAFNTDRERLSAAQLVSLYDHPFHVIWEPGIVFRFGWENFLFHTGYSYSTDLTAPGLYRSNGNFSLGFSLRFNTGKTSKTK